MLNQLAGEIESNLKNQNYLSVLTLTLTLPDICGSIAYPKYKVGERYSKWYNEYIYKYEIPKEGLKELTDLVNNGEIVYKLRCALFHEGSTDVTENIKKIKGFPNHKVLTFY